MNTMKMKMSLILLLQIFAFSLLVSPVHAQSGSITVSSVSQRSDGSGKVDVKYNLNGPHSSYNIAVEVSFNGGNSYSPISSNYLSGQLSNVSPGSNKQIVWDAMGWYPNNYSNQTIIKLIAFENAFKIFFDIGTLINDGSPENETYHYSSQKFFPLPDGKVFVSYGEYFAYPTQHMKYFILDSNLNIEKAPSDLIENDHHITTDNYCLKNNQLLFSCLHVTPGRDVLKFGKIDLYSYSSDYIGNLGWWPTDAFSDNEITKLFLSKSGTIFLVNSWRYISWSNAKEDLYIARSDDFMQNWSSWFYGGHTFGEGTVTCNTAIEYNNEILLCLQSTWGGSDKVVFVKFNMNTNTFSSFIHIANGSSPCLFIDNNNLSIAYINGEGSVVAKCSTVENWTNWSNETSIGFPYNNAVHLTGNKDTAGPFDNERNLLLITQPSNQFIWEWLGGDSWANLGLTTKTKEDAYYIGGRISILENGRFALLKGYESIDKGRYYTHISIF